MEDENHSSKSAFERTRYMKEKNKYRGKDNRKNKSMDRKYSER